MARLFWPLDKVAARWSSWRNRDHSSGRSEGGQGREDSVPAVRVEMGLACRCGGDDSSENVA